MSNLFPSGQAKPDAAAAPEPLPGVPTGTRPVEGNEGGKDAQTKTYTEQELQSRLKDRLGQQKRHYEREIKDLRAQYDAPAPVTEEAEDAAHPAAAPVPTKTDDPSAKTLEQMKSLRQRNKELAEQVNKYRDDGLKTAIKEKLLDAGCVEPDLVISHFISNRQVKYDSDGGIYAETADGPGTVDDLIREFLATRKHLVRTDKQSGAGTKQPSLVTRSRKEEIEQALGIQSVTKDLWNRK